MIPGRNQVCRSRRAAAGLLLGAALLLAQAAGGCPAHPGAGEGDARAASGDARPEGTRCEPESCGPGALCTPTRTGVRCDCLPGYAAGGAGCIPGPGQCGDGEVGAGEVCDDGNDVAGDGCDARCLSEEVAYADEVVAAPGAWAADNPFSDPSLAVNGVRGCGDGCGSVDVFSLGLTPGVDNYLVLRWSGRVVRNGPGPDFVVFENGFRFADGDYFMDLLVVEVSRDGTTWVALPHDYQAPDERSYSTDPEDWQGFAGRYPVRLHEEDNPVDPFDPVAAGGDAFDLADLPEGIPGATAIRTEGFRFLRLTTAPSLVNPDTGEPYPKEAISNGADVDGVYARWLVPE